MVDIPLSTIITFSGLAAKRMPHEGTDQFGRRSKRSCSAFGGTCANMPPFTGSITITFFPCLLRSLIHRQGLMLSLSQSRVIDCS